MIFTNSTSTSISIYFDILKSINFAQPHKIWKQQNMEGHFLLVSTGNSIIFHPNKNEDIHIHSMEVVIIVGKPSRKFLFLLPLDSILLKAKLPDM